MNSSALFLVLSASLLHLGWNSLTKGARDKLAFVWLALLPAALVGAVVLAWSLHPAEAGVIGIACLFASGLVHALYFWLLASAYVHADLSFVYPYCRGLGALLATGAGLALLGEQPSGLGFLGLGLTLSAPGLEAVSLRNGRAIGRRGWALTLLTGASIGAYLVIDKIGVAHVDPVPYLAGILAVPAVVLGPGLVLSGRARAELARSRHRPFVAAVFLCSAYGVVLAAMQMAPVSYVVAARATGIIASGAAGILLFRERVAPARWAAIAAVAAGVCCIGLA